MIVKILFYCEVINLIIKIVFDKINMGDKMSEQNRVTEIIEGITSKGSDIPYTDELQHISEDLIKKDYSLEDTLKMLSENVKLLTEEFLEGN